jgi:hypothetical protein
MRALHCLYLADFAHPIFSSRKKTKNTVTEIQNNVIVVNGTSVIAGSGAQKAKFHADAFLPHCHAKLQIVIPVFVAKIQTQPGASCAGKLHGVGESPFFPSDTLRFGLIADLGQEIILAKNVKNLVYIFESALRSQCSIMPLWFQGRATRATRAGP